MTHHKILIVEDNEKLASIMARIVANEGYTPLQATNIRDAMEIIQEEKISLVILDRMLPDGDGLKLIQQMDLDKSNMKVMFVSVKSASADKIAGLRHGAADYLAKPFEPEELILRIHNLLKPKKEKSKEFYFGKNYANLGSHIAVNEQKKSKMLSEKEIELLSFFIKHANQFVKREDILNAVWHIQTDKNTRTLDSHVARLRKFFEPNQKVPKHFITKRNTGYMFKI